MKNLLMTLIIFSFTYNISIASECDKDTLRFIEERGGSKDAAIAYTNNAIQKPDRHGQQERLANSIKKCH